MKESQPDTNYQVNELFLTGQSTKIIRPFLSKGKRFNSFPVRKEKDEKNTYVKTKLMKKLFFRLYFFQKWS